eukprot:5749607-Amphidinium_carterae.1
MEQLMFPFVSGSRKVVVFLWFGSLLWSLSLFLGLSFIVWVLSRCRLVANVMVVWRASTHARRANHVFGLYCGEG